MNSTKGRQPERRGQTATKRAVIYLRVSSPKQVNKELDPEGLSLPSQRKRCEAEAEKLGAEVVREYVEPGVSGGSVLKRKAFKRMLADIEKHRDVDVVIFWKVSRWARDEIDQWTAFGILQQQGVELAVLPTDVVNAADRRPVSQGAVRSALVVVAKEGWQGAQSLG